jgi:hypothetical protein
VLRVAQREVPNECDKTIKRLWEGNKDTTLGAISQLQVVDSSGLRWDGMVVCDWG